MWKYVLFFTLCLPYSAKFSRHMVFRGLVWNRENIKGVANRISLTREMLQITRSAKIVHLENLALYGATEPCVLYWNVALTLKGMHYIFYLLCFLAAHAEA